VNVNRQAQLQDDTDRVDILRLENIVAGDFLEVEASQLGDGLVATRIDRVEADKESIQAPVDSFLSGTEITVLGLTYSTAGAEFENQEDDDISSSMFYAQLQEGDLVRIEDESPADAIADEVEFEQADVLDGDDDFDQRADDDEDADDPDEDESDDDDEFDD
jgi:Domain of unknown function (DUF5666)